jgi:hypothetical protein
MPIILQDAKIIANSFGCGEGSMVAGAKRLNPLILNPHEKFLYKSALFCYVYVFLLWIENAIRINKISWV